MNILILSKIACGSDLAYRLTNEGHQVKMHIEDETFRDVGDGFFAKVRDWQAHKRWANLIVIDDCGMGKISESLKKEGYVVWGGSEWSDQIEMDRGKGQKLFKDMGMHVIPSHEFTNFEQGIAFVKSKPGRYVIKPSGPIQDEKALTYVGKEESGSDTISTLEQYKSKWSAKITKFELQEFKKGIEVGVSGFFNGKDFVEPIVINFEHKKLMAGNIGPGCGEMGTGMIWMSKRKIFRETLGRSVKWLAQNNYRGDIDINCIATDKEIYPLEWTARFGYPTTELKMETIKGDLGKWMYQLAKGGSEKFSISNPYSICVVVATPPFPFESEDLYKKYGEDQEVIFRTKDHTGIWPSEIRKEKDQWFLAGESGCSVICTGQGKSIAEAKKMAYKRVESFTIPNSFWRIDIGDKTDSDLKSLNQWGWFVL